MLMERLERFDVPVWLVNTGWTGGPYGTGERMNIAHTRNMVRAAIDGDLDGVETVIDPIFRRRGPGPRPGRPDEVLQPRATWADPDAYDRTARRLAAMFHDNFAEYADGVRGGPRRGPVVDPADLDGRPSSRSPTPTRRG